jgi:hypothetical protein
MDFDFEVRNHIEFLKHGEYFDLHNDFDIASITSSEAEVSIFWRKSASNSGIYLRFCNMDVFVVRLRSERPGEGLGMFQFAGFAELEEEPFTGRIIEFGDQRAGTCFSMVFEGGELRVRSERATLESI